jgi:hypothetical protein
VVDLEAELVALEEAATVRVATDFGGLEAAALAGPGGATAGGAAGDGPDVVALELARVPVGAVGLAAAGEGLAAGGHAATGLREVDADNEVTPGRG